MDASSDKIAIIEAKSNKKFSYKVLHKQIDFLELYLRQSGVNPGSKVLLLIPPSFNFCAYFYALQNIGAVIVLADIEMGEANFLSRMDLVRPDFTITYSLITKASRLRLGRFLAYRIARIQLPDVSKIQTTFIYHPRKSSTFSRTVKPKLKRSKENDALIIFTSGTLAAPKAVVHSWESINHNFAEIQQLFVKHNIRTVFTSQPYIFLPNLNNKGTAVITPRMVSPKVMVRLLKRYQVDTLFLLPTELNAFITQRVKLPETVKKILTGSAPVYKSFLKKAKKWMPQTEIWSVYGMTEILPVAFIEATEKLNYKGAGDLVGKPLSSVQVKTNTSGEVELKGVGRFKNYVNKAAAVWHQTGDFGVIDTQGRLVLKGRKKDMIIRRNFNIYPALYEPIIESLPGVLRAKMVGCYSEALADEKVILAIEPMRGHQLSASAILKKLSHGSYSIDKEALPDHILFINIPEKGRNRKIDTARIRQQFLTTQAA